MDETKTNGIVGRVVAGAASLSALGSPARATGETDAVRLLWRQEQQPILLRLEEHQRAAPIDAVRNERDVLADLLNDLLVQLGERAPD